MSSLAPETMRLDQRANDVSMTPEEFDAVQDWDPGFRYELVRGVVIVNPIPLEGEADPNEELGRWLRNYQESHPQGQSLDRTLPERYVYLLDGSRRRADRVIWTGLGRRPRPKLDVPTIVIEFVSQARRDWLRDFVEKRGDYLELGVQEHWVIDRFRRLMQVFTPTSADVVSEDGIYQTPKLPGFELPLKKLLLVADAWELEDDPDTDSL
jgi:Uma2 family endonuclease